MMNKLIAILVLVFTLFGTVLSTTNVFANGGHSNNENKQRIDYDKPVTLEEVNKYPVGKSRRENFRCEYVGHNCIIKRRAPSYKSQFKNRPKPNHQLQKIRWKH